MSVPRFAPYLPRFLVEWQGRAPGTDHTAVDGTLVLADIVGFTTMSERLARFGKIGAEEVAGVVARVASALLAAAAEDGGSLVKFGGDALLLIFTGDGHARRAARAALRMRTALAAASGSTSVGAVRLRMRIVATTGKIHAFLAGGSHRELLLVGPAVTEVAELEEVGGAGEILVADRLAAELDPTVLGPPRARGRVLRRVCIDDAPSPVSRAAPAVPHELGTYIPEALRAHLAADTPESEHRHVAVGFVRFVGTDEMLRGAGTKATARALDDLMRGAQATAAEHGVTFLGSDIQADGGKLVLLAGAPATAGDDEHRLLLALRALVTRPSPLSVRAGAHVGNVFVGDVGSSDQRCFTVMGDAVNLAARLMGVAGTGELVATTSIVERALVRFESRALPPLAVRGKREAVEAVHVGAPLGSRARQRAEQRLVGRDNELAALAAAVAAASNGRGQLVEVVGPAGMGKSRIVDELRARHGHALRAGVRCDPYSARTPHATLRQLLRQVLGIPLHADAEAVASAFDCILDEHAPELRPWASLMGNVIGAAALAGATGAAIAPEHRQGRLHSALADLLTAVLHDPTVVVIEDAHWMDDASARFLRYLGVGILASQPWLICLTRRDGDATVAAPGAPVVRLDLGPLDDESALALLAEGEPPLPLPQMQAIVARASGHPMHLLELAAAVRAGRDVDELPVTVEAVIRAHLDRLAVSDRNVLAHAAVLGLTFDADALTHLLATERRHVPRGIWARVDEVIEATGSGRYVFRHRLFRDAAYESLSFKRRRDLHGAAAAFLESRHRDRADEIAGLLALHFEQARSWPDAWRYARIAGDDARARGANVEAARFYRRAIDAGQRLPEVEQHDIAQLWEAVGDVSELAGLYTDAADAYREARARFGPEALPRLHVKEGMLRERLGRYPAALRWYTRGLALKQATVRDRVELELAAAVTRVRQGRAALGAQLAERVLSRTAPDDDPAPVARAHFVLGWARTDLGQPAEMHELAALQLYEQLGDTAGQGHIHTSLGISAYYAGRWDLATHHYEQARVAWQRTGHVVHEATAVNNLAEILSDQGYADAAERRFHEALRAWRGASFSVGIALATSNLGRVAARSGRTDDALELLDEALERFVAMGAASFAAETRARLAERAVLAGDPTTARAIAADVCAVGQVAPAVEVMLRRVDGYAWVQQGDVERARAQFEAALAAAQAGELAYEEALTVEALERLAELTGTARGDDRPAADLLAALGVVATPDVPLRLRAGKARRVQSSSVVLVPAAR